MWKEERRFGELNIENAETTIDENKVESDRDVIPFPPSECHNSLPYSYFVTAIQPNWSLFFEQQHIDEINDEESIFPDEKIRQNICIFNDPKNNQFRHEKAAETQNANKMKLETSIKSVR